MGKGGYAPVNGPEPCHEVYGEEVVALSEERPEAVTVAISDLLSARSRP